MGTAPYTELEYLILAMVGEGINSGYAMRKTMNRMRGGRWSSESGSVYRVLRRFAKDGMLCEARRVGVPNRQRTEYELTTQGELFLNSWMTVPADRSEFAYLVDPIRTRSYFLSRLAPPERVRVVSNWLAESKSFCLELERELKETALPDPLRNLAYFNLLHLAKARHEWLKKMLAAVKEAVPEEEEELSTDQDKLAVAIS